MLLLADITITLIVAKTEDLLQFFEANNGI